MLLGTLDANLLENLLTGEELKAKIPRKGEIRAGEGTIRTGEEIIRQVTIFNAVSSFNKFWHTKYYQNKSKFYGVYSRNNLPKIKDGMYVINFCVYKSIGTYWIAIYVNGN